MKKKGRGIAGAKMKAVESFEKEEKTRKNIKTKKK